MKRGIIALVILLIAIAAAGIEYMKVCSSVQVYITMLNEADEQMEKNEIYNAEETIRKLDHRFSVTEKALNVFLIHSKLSEISKNIAMLRRYAQVGATAEFLAVSAATKRALLSIHNSELPSAENIL